MKKPLWILCISLSSCTSRIDTIKQNQLPVIKDGLLLVQELSQTKCKKGEQCEYAIMNGEIKDLSSTNSSWADLSRIFNSIPDSTKTIIKQKITDTKFLYSFLIDIEALSETYIVYDNFDYLLSLGVMDDVLIQELEPNWYIVVEMSPAGTSL